EDRQPGGDDRRYAHSGNAGTERLKRERDEPDVQRRLRVVVVGRAVERCDDPVAALEHLERARGVQRFIPFGEALVAHAKGEIEGRQREDGRREHPEPTTPHDGARRYDGYDDGALQMSRAYSATKPLGDSLSLDHQDARRNEYVS